MANSRIINTSFWRDNYIMELDPSEKLLFLYFLTNPNTTLAGVYEVNLRTVAFETGFDVDMIQKILNRFCIDGKMNYERGWLVLTNFIKHQRLNPSIKRGIQHAISELPVWLQDKISIQTENDQLLLEFTEVETQSDDSLGTVTPQMKLNEAKLNEAKLIKPNAPTSRGFKNPDLDKKAYAKSAQADRDQAERADAAKSRPPMKSAAQVFGGKA